MLVHNVCSKPPPWFLKSNFLSWRWVELSNRNTTQLSNNHQPWLQRLSLGQWHVPQQCVPGTVTCPTATCPWDSDMSHSNVSWDSDMSHSKVSPGQWHVPQQRVPGTVKWPFSSHSNVSLGQWHGLFHPTIKVLNTYCWHHTYRMQIHTWHSNKIKIKSALCHRHPQL